jgi:Ca2+-binding EF-hand superfamily protein
MRIVMNDSKFRPRALLALALSAALVSTVAIAQQAAPAASPDAPRQRLDANGDGAIDKGEAANAPRLAEKFDQLDSNHDGRLTADERPQAGRGARGGSDGEGGGMHERMQQLDTDHDGRISSKEAAAKPEMAQRFAQMDSNHDGFLDRSDFQAHRQQQRDECFANADADKDGKLSRGEYDAAHQQCQSHGGKRGPRGGGDTPAPPPAG